MHPPARVTNPLRGLTWRALLPELQGAVGAVVPLLNAYAVLWLLATQGWLPATTTGAGPLNEIRDEVFLTPIDWAVLVALAIAIATAYLIWWPPLGWGFRADQIETPARRETLIGLLAGVGLFTLLGGDPVLILLTAPAGLWIWIRPRGPGAGQALNGMLWIGGLLPWIAAGLMLATSLPTPAFVWWHFMAAAAYGVLPGGSVIAWLVLMALGARFLRLGMMPK